MACKGLKCPRSTSALYTPSLSVGAHHVSILCMFALYMGQFRHTCASFQSTTHRSHASHKSLWSFETCICAYMGAAPGFKNDISQPYVAQICLDLSATSTWPSTLCTRSNQWRIAKRVVRALGPCSRTHFWKVSVSSDRASLYLPACASASHDEICESRGTQAHVGYVRHSSCWLTAVHA